MNSQSGLKTHGQKRVLGYGKSGRSRLISQPSRPAWPSSSESRPTDATLKTQLAVRNSTSAGSSSISSNTERSPSTTSKKPDTQGRSVHINGPLSKEEVARKRKISAVSSPAKTPPKRQHTAQTNSKTTETRLVQATPQPHEPPKRSRPVQVAKRPYAVVNEPKPAPTPVPAPLSKPTQVAPARPTATPRQVPTPKTPASIAAHPRKTRLIDRLRAEKAESPDEESSPSDDDPSSPLTAPRAQTPPSQQDRTDQETILRPPPSLTRSSTGKRIKYGYSSARAPVRRAKPKPMAQLTESDEFKAPEFNLEELLSSPSKKPEPDDDFAFPDSDSESGGDNPKVTIKSVHELRRAGANHRFADEMEDLLSRVGSMSGKASSIRRNALLEIASKLEDESFTFQFRNHAGRDRVVSNIGAEEDAISGFSLMAILLILLSTNPSPHMLWNLVEHKAGKLLGRMLPLGVDITAMAAERSMNLSKASRKTLSNIKSRLSKMPLWHGCTVQNLSPRTAALKLLDLLVQHLDAKQQAQVLGGLKDELASILEHQAREGSEKDIDFILTASVLQHVSSNKLASGTPNQALYTAQLLDRALKKWQAGQGEWARMVLKASINMTNTEDGAEAFSSEKRMDSLAYCLSDGMATVQKLTHLDRFQDDTYDAYILILGLTINILEHCSSARNMVSDEALGRLANIFLDNHSIVKDADSEDKSKVSVAFGYFAVALGYLALNVQVRQIIAHQSQGKGIGELVTSIKDFIVLYQSVGKVNEFEGLVGELQHFSR